MADPVSWLMIETGWDVLAADGTKVGEVEEIAGDDTEDIFDGLAIATSALGKPRLVGINHVALEVDDVEEAVEFFGGLFEIASIEREPGGASIEIGDQFIALFERGAEEQHFGLVVDDKAAVRERLAENGVEMLP